MEMVSARAQSAFGKRVRDVCALADRACAAAAAEEERAVKRQLVLWQSDRWAREWAVAFAARRAGILSPYPRDASLRGAGSRVAGSRRRIWPY